MPPRFLDRLRRRGLRRRPGRQALDVAPSLPERDVARTRAAGAELLRFNDTVTQREEAAIVADAYLTLDERGRRAFLSMLARDFWVDEDAVERAIDGRHRVAFGDQDARRRADRALRDALQPPASG